MCENEKCKRDGEKVVLPAGVVLCAEHAEERLLFGRRL